MPSLAERALPFAVVVGVEHDVVIGGDREPAIGLDLGIELARRPAGIAEREQAAARPPPLPIARRMSSVAVIAISPPTTSVAFLAVIGGVQHKAAAGLDRTAEMHRARLGERRSARCQLGEQLVHGQRRRAAC